MTDTEILGHIDHTLLKADASWEAIHSLCTEAVQYKTASVCIPPSYVKPVHEVFGTQLTLCTVVGFPLGYSVGAVKAAETAQALADGAAEIDMVIPIGDVKNRRFDRVLEEITLLKRIVGDRILKVIVETCYLTEDEKIRLCDLVTQAQGDYIKTSTGFGTAGAALEDIHLFKKYIGPQVKIKAAGGIRTREDLEVFLAAGCDRIGTSSAVALLRGRSA
ncbi:MAG: deoxyribose-phosphate aldolase [Spirochaetaceae bacterium]|jgi:deoxyribose-phosphate aldolase|nr:deoxyribose-phosphate aldolase [Spirochaetaceae bacterium]